MTTSLISADRAAARPRPDAQRRVVVAAPAVGIYLAALDISIVNAILPVVADAFGTDLAAIQWVATVYLLVQSALLLAVGRLGDLWSHRKAYLLGLVVFVLASVVYVLGLGLLLLGLNQGHAWGWTSLPILGCLLLGTALLAGWAAIELRVPSPMVD